MLTTAKVNVKRFGDKKEPATVDCILVKENAKTVLVQLPDGNRIYRHKTKHSVGETQPFFKKSPETT